MFKTSLIRSTLLCATGLVLFSGAPTHAQTQQQTGIASPDRVEDQFRQPSFETRLSPDIEIKELKLQSAPEGAVNIVFTLTSIQLDGVSAYETAELQSVYANKLGQEVSLTDIYGIASDLTKKYRNDGFILTQVIVPIQTIEGGIVRLQVVEGYIDNITVERADGEETGALNLFRDYTSTLQGKKILNIKDLERVTLLISDVAGARARTVLTPSVTQTGASDLSIVIERTPYEGELTLDNYGTRYLGPLQAGASIAAHSYFDQNERITAQFFMTPEDFETPELLYLALGYEQPVNKYGTTVGINGTFTKTEPGYDLEQFDVRGWSSTLSANIQHPFVRSRSMNLSGRAIFDYHKSTTKNNILIDPTRRDHIRALRVGGNFEYLDNLFGLAFNNVDVLLSQGLNIMGANARRQQDQSRPGADPKFTKLEATIERLQRLNHNFNLQLSVNGQWSSSPLASSEEYGLGGSRYGRGYDPSEVIGDNGLAGTVELQWQTPYPVPLFDDYQLYGFFDAGRVWDDTSTKKLRQETLTSTGVGLRGNISERTSVGALFALPLNTTPQTQGDQDARLFFNVSRSF